jgi:excisionase family DNA binding protein
MAALARNEVVKMVLGNRVKKSFCTTREAAELLGVSLRTAQLWVENGQLQAWKTNGGHRRIARDSVERLLVQPVEAEALVAQWGSTDPQTSGESARLNILVAEDEPTLRLIYEVNLARWDLKPTVTTAGDGYEALIRIGHSRPDLLIADLQMPGMDGFRMLRTIRAMPELDSMAIVVVTGLDAEDIADHGGLPSGIPVLPKPGPFSRLREIADRVAAERGRLRTGVTP